MPRKITQAKAFQDDYAQGVSQRTDTIDKLVKSCAARIRQVFGKSLPRRALVLGSGFQAVLDAFQVEAQIDYSELPGFPELHVKGHAGRLLLVAIGGALFLVCSGRAHYYEGHSPDRVMFPTRVLAYCGVKEMILTNAAGGISPRFRPGDFMLFTDHINFSGVNPLRGIGPFETGAAFLDLSDAYSSRLGKQLARAAKTSNVRLHKGVYLGVSGPSYETPAEIRAFRRLGADAVGMSTIPEVLMARYCGIEVAAISCITNPAAGLSQRKVSHTEVLDTGRRSAEAASRLLTAFGAIVGKGSSESTAAQKKFENQSRASTLRV
jgi:purine-nucleoside phosphorylase